jgi:hypothetical protein
MEQGVETSIAGSPAYVCTVAGGGVNSTKFQQADLLIDAKRPAWSGMCKLTCSSAADGCEPEVFWVPRVHAAGQWLQCSLETPACIVGLRIGSNQDGSKGEVGRGFHTTQISVQVQLEASASQWHNVVLANPPANFPPSGGTVMFGTAALVRALRIMPTAWGESGIGLHVTMLEELVAGPLDIRFNLCINHGISFDHGERKLIACDNSAVETGGITHFRVIGSDSPAVTLRSLHVPRPQIWSGVAIRRVSFGSLPRTMFAISNVKIFEGAVGGVIRVLAGGGVAGNNATGEAAGFHSLNDLCVTDANIYVADQNMIRRCTFSGVVTTFAGASNPGHVDAAGEAARFNGICGLAYDEHSATIVCADTANHRIRKICMGAHTTTVAGTGIAELKNGLGTAASFSSPRGVVTWKRWIFVSDSGNHALRCITPDGLVSTLAGGRSAGFRDGVGSKALLNSPESICHDNQGRFYFIDLGNQRIRSFVANVTDVIPPARSDLPGILASLCDEKLGSGNDVIFNVGGKQVFAVRSLIEARSSYFKVLLGDSRDTRMLASDQERKEGRTARFTSGTPVKIDVADASYLAFRCVIRYLHSDLVRFPEEGDGATADVALEILQLACKYQLPRLQIECERLIAESITCSNACSLLAAADRCNTTPPAGGPSHRHVANLRSLCKAFVIRNFAQVRRSPDFSCLPQHLLVEIALQLTVQG